MKEFDAKAERHLARMEVDGRRYYRALVPPGEYTGGWEAGARVQLPDREIAWCRFVLVDYDVGGTRIDLAAERGTRKWRRIARALGISPRWDELPTKADDMNLVVVLTLDVEPEPLGSVVRGIRPATPDDIVEVTDEILLELQKEDRGG